MTHVKIDGFQTAEPAVAAIEAGADSIGLVFVPSARRRLTLEEARDLLTQFREQVGHAAPDIVGLFADQPVADVQEHIGLLGLDAVQLCGAEDVRYAEQLGVPVFVIKSVREQMRFDVTEIIVEAGKDFEIIFVNEDMMPHNVVVVEPGAREEVGKKADQMVPTPDRRGRTYVPRDRRILAASRMIEPGMRTSLKMKAPETVGDYEYICTYPEHWLVMFGKLVVVDDLEKYLESRLAR